MNLARLKQNLRIRSERFKRTTKRAATPSTASNSQSTQTAGPHSFPAGQSSGYVATPPVPIGAVLDGRVGPDTTGEGRIQANSTSKTGKGRDVPAQGPEDSVAPYVQHGQEVGLDRQADQRETAPHTTATALVNGMRLQQQGRHPTGGHTIDADMGNVGADLDVKDFDLRPPAPRPKPPSAESTSQLLFSAGHLNTIIYTPAFLAEFAAFLRQYRPREYPLLMRYLKTSKAIKAIEYANAVAASAPSIPLATNGHGAGTANTAAIFDTAFKEAYTSAHETLLNTSLPLYLTYALIRTISECLVDEITGCALPTARDMVGGLSEVFCLTDPTQEDNPIVYSSKEFYRLTGYGPDDVIGRNCRFLQGPKTKRSSPQRLRESLDRGEEICETLLNYRKDGEPFLNVLMIAPLHDDQGQVRYHIGAQIDVSKVVESGAALSSFQKYRVKNAHDTSREAEENSQRGGHVERSQRQQALRKLRELSELFDLDETTVMQSHSRSSSMDRKADSRSAGSRPVRRRFVDPEDVSDEAYDPLLPRKQSDWNLGQSGPLGLSGRLPGIYEKYMLIRPAPSLRIVFVSPKLHKFGDVVQNPFLSHVTAPARTLHGVAESLRDGIPVSAKIHFTPQKKDDDQGTGLLPGAKMPDGKSNYPCWMSATPLFGGDDRVGVWMIVFIEKVQVKSRRLRKSRPLRVIETQEAKRSVLVKAVESLLRQQPAGPSRPDQLLSRVGERSNWPTQSQQAAASSRSMARRRYDHASATAYRHQAASPVEEYQSPDDEDQSSSSFISTGQLDTASQTPTYHIMEGGGFVHVASDENPSRRSPVRLRIHPDGDVDHHNRRDAPLLRPSLWDHEPLKDDRGVAAGNISTSRLSVRDHVLPGKTDQDQSSATQAPGSGPTAGQDGLDQDHQRTNERAALAHQQKSFLSPLPPAVEALESSVRSPSARSCQTRTARSSDALPADLEYIEYIPHPMSGRRVSEEAQRGRERLRREEVDDDQVI